MNDRKNSAANDPLSLLIKNLIGQKVINNETPHYKLLAKVFLFSCLFNDVGSNSGYCI